MTAKVSLFFSAQIIFGKQLGTHGNTIPTMVYRHSLIQTCPVAWPGLLSLCDCDLTKNKEGTCQPVGMHGPYFDINVQFLQDLLGPSLLHGSNMY